MASMLYMGTRKGVVTLKSDDGRSWKTENHGLQNWEIPKIAVDPSAPNRIFAATRGDGVWLSEDFGNKWTKPCYGKRGPGKVRGSPVNSSYDAHRHRHGDAIAPSCRPRHIRSACLIAP